MELPLVYRGMRRDKREALSKAAEKSLTDLEALVERMEEGELSLEESLKAFEAGIRLTQQCQQALDKAQQHVHVLMQGDDETLSIEGIEDEPDATEPDS